MQMKHAQSVLTAKLWVKKLIWRLTYLSKMDVLQFAICGECGKTFDDTQSCEEHIETAHLMPQQCEPFPCDECGLVLVCYNFQKNVQK